MGKLDSSKNLNLIDYIVKECSYELLDANKYEAAIKSLIPDSVGIGVQISEISGPNDETRGQNVVRVAMKLVIGPENDPDVPFRASIELLSMLGSQYDFWEDEEALLNIVSAAISVMFGAARERLAAISSGGPNPKLILPLIAPTEVAKDAIKTFSRSRVKLG